MAHSIADAGKKIMMKAAAVLSACILVMGCSAPAYARMDPGSNGRNDAVKEESSAEAYNKGNHPVVGNTGDGSPGKAGDWGNNSGENDGDNDSGGDNGENTAGNNEENDSSGESTPGNTWDGNEDSATAEPGFTSPGNGSIGDRIKNSNGKDFFTVRTKNNNTFYLVIDHANSTDNVYMLSLIDENDLSEFLEETQKKEEKTTAPVIIPQTKTQTETETNEKSEKKETQQPVQAPFQNSFIWILILAGAVIAAAYYFKIYKPGHEEEEDDSEGMESADDGFETENEG